jgi:hypothetical protein
VQLAVDVRRYATGGRLDLGAQHSGREKERGDSESAGDWHRGLGEGRRQS